MNLKRQKAFDTSINVLWQLKMEFEEAAERAEGGGQDFRLQPECELS